MDLYNAISTEFWRFPIRKEHKVYRTRAHALTNVWALFFFKVIDTSSKKDIFLINYCYIFKKKDIFLIQYDYAGLLIEMKALYSNSVLH